jgi:plastocyanin
MTGVFQAFAKRLRQLIDAMSGGRTPGLRPQTERPRAMVSTTVQAGNRIRITQKAGAVVFEPANLVIPKNESVFWLNEDTEEHQINLTEEVLKKNETSTAVVITADREYFCMKHPQEKGKITIQVPGVA